jgi:hypothetical protein
MALIRPTRTESHLGNCARFTPPAACQTLGTVDPPVPLTPNETAKNLCARLFPDQEVMQSACRSRCADHYYKSPGDAQECAFNFARTSREVAPPTVKEHTVLWAVVLILGLIAAAWFGYRRYRKKPE